MIYYSKPPPPLDADKLIGHFTQIVNENTTRVGCGRVKFNWPDLIDWKYHSPIYVCNYHEPGNVRVVGIDGRIESQPAYTLLSNTKPGSEDKGSESTSKPEGSGNDKEPKSEGGDVSKEGSGSNEVPESQESSESNAEKKGSDTAPESKETSESEDGSGTKEKQTDSTEETSETTPKTEVTAGNCLQSLCQNLIVTLCEFCSRVR